MATCQTNKLSCWHWYNFNRNLPAKNSGWKRGWWQETKLSSNQLFHPHAFNQKLVCLSSQLANHNVNNVSASVWDLPRQKGLDKLAIVFRQCCWQQNRVWDTGAMLSKMEMIHFKWSILFLYLKLNIPIYLLISYSLFTATSCTGMYHLTKRSRRYPGHPLNLLLVKSMATQI